MLNRAKGAMNAKSSNSLAGAGTGAAPTAAPGSGTMLGQLFPVTACGGKCMEMSN